MGRLKGQGRQSGDYTGSACCSSRLVDEVPLALLMRGRSLRHNKWRGVASSRAYVLIGGNGVGKTKTLKALFQVAAATTDAYGNLGSGLTRASLVFKSVTLNDKYFDSEAAEHVYNEFEFLRSNTAHGQAVVYAGAQGRGSASFMRRSQESGAPLGTKEQRREAYKSSVLEGMHSNFKAMNMHNDIDRWFVLRAQSANRYQASADNRVVEIETVLRLLNRIDSRIDSEFLKLSGSALVSIKVAWQERQLDELSSGFTAIVRLVQTIVIAQCRPGESYRLERHDDTVCSRRIGAPSRMALVDAS